MTTIPSFRPAEPGADEAGSVPVCRHQLCQGPLCQPLPQLFQPPLPKGLIKGERRPPLPHPLLNPFPGFAIHRCPTMRAGSRGRPQDRWSLSQHGPTLRTPNCGWPGDGAPPRPAHRSGVNRAGRGHRHRTGRSETDRHSQRAGRQQRRQCPQLAEILSHLGPPLELETRTHRLSPNHVSRGRDAVAKESRRAW